MRYLFCVIFPPIALLLCGRPIQACISIPLTLLLWIPGMIHAFFVVAAVKTEERQDELITAMGGTPPRRDASTIEWGLFTVCVVAFTLLIAGISKMNAKPERVPVVVTTEPAPANAAIAETARVSLPTPLRNWTNAKGEVTRGRALSVSGETMHFEREDGAAFPRAPISSLSAEDQEYIRRASR